LAKYYLGFDEPLAEATRTFIADCQDPDTGLLIGPELRAYEPPAEVMHDREHLLFHLTCTALPTCQHFDIPVKYAVSAAHRFCDLNVLQNWMDRRDLKNAWVEGNNILFVGQLLVYLRDVERYPGAQAALDMWFYWLDTHLDPANGLWGTNGYCSALHAVCGGYHQLLVYYHEHHCLANPSGMVDTVLSLQHWDGGFNPDGNAGACEDVDSVDILVNLYKRLDYRRADIRVALRRCLRHVLATQNVDGGFPYNLNSGQSHMGIPGTQALPNMSTTFSTWFRIHTLALIAEILSGEPDLAGVPFRFSKSLSMGWHRSPTDWVPKVTIGGRWRELHLTASYQAKRATGLAINQVRRIKRFGRRVLWKIKLR